MSATGRGAERRTNDAYATPRWCVDALLDAIAGSDKLRDVGEWADVLDPCCGDGAILTAITDRYSEVRPHGVDLMERAGPSFAYVADWLTYEWEAEPWPQRTRIVTNPPYRLAADFVRRALMKVHGGWWLLRLPFLGSDRSRRDLWPFLREVLVLTPRPSFTGGGTDATEYAWFRFEPGDDYCGPPKLGWVRKGDR